MLNSFTCKEIIRFILCSRNELKWFSCRAIFISTTKKYKFQIRLLLFEHDKPGNENCKRIESRFTLNVAIWNIYLKKMEEENTGSNWWAAEHYNW